MRARATGAYVAGVLAMALLAGCGDGPEPPDDTDTPDADDVAPSNPQWDDESPLDAYLRVVLGDFESDDAYADPLRAPAEEAVSACMAQAGFEYHPMLEEPSYVSGGWRDLPHAVEVAEEFGYGFSIEAEGRGNGTARWSVPNQEGQAERANREYKESLSPAARAEYERVLLGDPLAVLEEGYDEMTDGGCYTRSYAEISTLMWPTEFAAVIDAMGEIYAQVESDPRVADAQRAWTSCMADAGYPDLTQLRDAQSFVDGLISRFVAENADRIDRSLAENEYDAIKASVPAELAELQAAERAVAVADATCRETSGYTRLHDEVTIEYEQDLVDRYRDDLEAWVAMVRERDADQTGD